MWMKRSLINDHVGNASRNDHLIAVVTGPCLPRVVAVGLPGQAGPLSLNEVYTYEGEPHLSTTSVLVLSTGQLAALHKRGRMLYGDSLITMLCDPERALREPHIAAFVSRGEPFLHTDGRVEALPLSVFGLPDGYSVLRVGGNAFYFDPTGTYDGCEAQVDTAVDAAAYTQLLIETNGNVGRAPHTSYYTPGQGSVGYAAETALWPGAAAATTGRGSRPRLNDVIAAARTCEDAGDFVKWVMSLDDLGKEPA